MIKPLFDNVLVKHEHKKETTSSGILLSAHEEESKYAVVVSTGEFAFISSPITRRRRDSSEVLR